MASCFPLPASCINRKSLFLVLFNPYAEVYSLDFDSRLIDIFNTSPDQYFFHFKAFGYFSHYIILKLSLCSWGNFTPGTPERADQSEENVLLIKSLLMLNQLLYHLKKKKIISMPLMMENPVRSPMVPPMRLSCASNLIFWSRSISSKVAVSK